MVPYIAASGPGTAQRASPRWPGPGRAESACLGLPVLRSVREPATPLSGTVGLPSGDHLVLTSCAFPFGSPGLLPVPACYVSSPLPVLLPLPLDRVSAASLVRHRMRDQIDFILCKPPGDFRVAEEILQAFL